MHVQAQTTSTVHRGPAQAALAALVALVVAGGTAGILAVTSNDGTTTHSSGTAVTRVAPDRVLDGSPILRGTAHVVAAEKVLDGSPILRGTASAPVATHSSSVQGTPRPPEGRPFGFRSIP
jgi:hypothetical protein